MKVNAKLLAKLAQLNITPKEEKKLQAGFKQIINTISDLDKLDTSKITKNFQVTNSKNVFRQDVVDKSRVLTQTQALSNAKKTYQGYFVVPAIFK